MRIKHLLSIYFYLSSLSVITAQEVTHQIYEEQELPSIVSNIYELEDTPAYLCTHIYSDTSLNTRILKIGALGEVLQVYELDSLLNFEVESVVHIIQEGNGFILFLTAKEFDNAFFINVRTDENFKALSLISARQLPHLKLEGIKTKYNPFLNRYDILLVPNEVVAVPQGFEDIYHLNVNEQFEIGALKRLETTSNFSYFATDFFYHPNLKRYSITTWLGGLKILDENWNVLTDKYQVGKLIEGSPISWVSKFDKESNCFINSNTGLECFGGYGYYENNGGANEAQTAGSFGTYDIRGDSIEFDIPVLDDYFENFELRLSPSAVGMTKDNIENYIIWGHDGGLNSELPFQYSRQRINIQKLSPEKEQIWELEYSLAEEGLIRILTSLIDKNNDLILMGNYHPWENLYGRPRVIFLKVYNDGSVTTNNVLAPEKLIRIYPNPTTQFATVELDASINDGHTTVHIYNNLGQELLQVPIEQQIQISTRGFTEGIYQVIITQNGSIIQKGRLVKQ